MTLLLLLALAIPAFSNFTEQDNKSQQVAAKAAYQKAEKELPPCEGQDHVEKVIRNFTPPADCPKAKRYFDHYLEASRKIREKCRETTQWLEGKIQKPNFCDSKESELSTQKILQSFKDQSKNAFADEKIDGIFANDQGLDYYLEGAGERAKTGEWSRPQCAHGVQRAMQLRTYLNGLIGLHFSKAISALESACQKTRIEADSYLKYLRYGEDGL